MTQHEILNAVNQKDTTSFHQVYVYFYASLCHYARRFLRDIGGEEDFVQEIFLKLWERENIFTSMEALTAYLYRAVHNACLNHIREQHALLSITSLYGENITEYSSKCNEQLLIEEEYFCHIYIVISQLPEQRRRIVLWAMEGKTNEEIAQELNISVNTVKTLKKKAYQSLRESLAYPAFVFVSFLL